jgi:hypothetical protein
MAAAVDVMMVDAAASVLSSRVARVAGCTGLVPVLVLLFIVSIRCCGSGTPVLSRGS